MKTIVRIAVVALAVLIAAKFIPGISVDTFWPTAVIASFVLGLLNLIIRPVVRIMTLPINILTLGLFTFVINAIFFWTLNLLDGVMIDGFVAALLGSLCVSIAKWAIDLFFD